MKKTELSTRIRKLRDYLGLTQHELAERIHVRPQVVASWEQGRKEPSAESCSQLARLANAKDSWFFLDRLGVSRDLVRAKWSDQTLSKVSRGGRPLNPKARIRSIEMSDPRFLQIPVLREQLPPDLRVLEQHDFESVITLPTAILPPGLGICVAIRHHGSLLAPVLEDQGVAVVDTSRRDPAKVSGRMVGLWGDQGPIIRWLFPRTGGPQTGPRAQIPAMAMVPMDMASLAQRIIGDVVFWFSRQG